MHKIRRENLCLENLVLTELLVILVIVIIVFGPKQLPKLSKMFGKTIKNFKEGMSEKDSDKSDDEE